jgi:hypothetical protein
MTTIRALTQVTNIQAPANPRQPTVHAYRLQSSLVRARESHGVCMCFCLNNLRDGHVSSRLLRASRCRLRYRSLLEIRELIELSSAWAPSCSQAMGTTVRFNLGQQDASRSQRHAYIQLQLVRVYTDIGRRPVWTGKRRKHACEELRVCDGPALSLAAVPLPDQGTFAGGSQRGGL